VRALTTIVPVTEGDRESIAIHVAGFTTTNMGNTCSSVHIALTGTTADAIEGVVRAYTTLGSNDTAARSRY
jgi:hypothetical protein